MNFETYEINVDQAAGTCMIRDLGGLWKLSNILPHVNGKAVEFLGFKVRQNDVGRIRIDYDIPDGMLTLDVEKFDADSAVMRLKTKALGNSGLSYQTAGPLYSTKVEGFDSAFRSGLHDWDPAAVHPLGGSARWRSYGLLGLTGRRNLLLGFIEHREAFNLFEYSADGRLLDGVKAICEYGEQGSAHQIKLQQNEEHTSEALFITQQNSLEDGLAHWANVTADTMKAKQWKSAVLGYDSWYGNYQHVTHERCLEALNALQQNAEQVPLEYFTVGMGYHQNLGDWLVPTQAYGQPVSETIKAIRDASLKPGLWLAPFAIGNRSDLFSQHPEWLLRRLDGSPIVVCKAYGEPRLWFGNEEIYAADPTNEEFLEYISGCVKTMRNEWGVDLLKLDLCHYACLPGSVYSNSSLTRVQAYRKAMNVIREAFGNGFLLGASVPLCNSIGIFDGCRVCGDLGPEWRNWYNSEVAMKAALSRSFMHRRFWLNEAGPVTVRDYFNDLDEQEVQTRGLVQGMTSGVFFTGDDVTCMSNERRELLRFLMPIHAEPPEVLDQARPRSGIIRKTSILDGEKFTALALVNLSDEEKPYELDPKEHGFQQGVHFFDGWRQEYFGQKHDVLRVAIAPHSSALYFLKDTAGRDGNVICSSSHMSGAEDIASIIYEKGELTINPLRSPCRVVVLMPEGAEAPEGVEVRKLGDGAFEMTIQEKIKIPIHAKEEALT